MSIERELKPIDRQLHLAVKEKDRVMIRQLVEDGADVNSRDKHWITPVVLCLFATREDEEFAKETVLYLLNHGAKPTGAFLSYAVSHKIAWAIEFLRNDSSVWKKDSFGRLPQHLTDTEESFRYMLHYLGVKEESITSESSEVLFGEWCESMYEIPSIDSNFSPAIRLHPIRDELIAAMPGGKLIRWRYNPSLEWVAGVQTEQYMIKDLTISPCGDWYALVAPHIWGIELRDVKTLKPIQLIQNQYTKDTEKINSLLISPEGNKIFTDYSFISEGKSLLEKGLFWYDRQINQFQTRLWDDLGFSGGALNIENHGYGSIEKMALSPDQQLLAIKEKDFYYGLLHIIPSVSNNKKDDIKYRFQGSYISDIAFHPDSKHIAVFNINYWRDTNGFPGDLKLVSASDRKEYWTVHIDEKVTGIVYTLPRYTAHKYAGKVLVGETEVVCTAPGGLLLFFDVNTGEFKRKQNLNVKYILDMVQHRDGDKIRVATDQELQIVELK